jgi:sacsin
MVPQPIGQNAQVQRLTTALKNICRDYPAGGTVLRELLQNADDAGATEVVRDFQLLLCPHTDIVAIHTR